MKISKAWLKKNDACNEGVRFFDSQKESDSNELIKLFIKSNGRLYLQWSNWLIVRTMNKTQRTRYALYAAESMIKIYETANPDDKRPREAINATKKCLKNNTIKNRSAADTAAYAADTAAAYAADATSACTAATAATAAATAAAATDTAAYAADAAYYTADAEIIIKILKYGLKIIKEGEQNETN